MNYRHAAQLNAPQPATLRRSALLRTATILWQFSATPLHYALRLAALRRVAPQRISTQRYFGDFSPHRNSLLLPDPRRVALLRITVLRTSSRLNDRSMKWNLVQPA